MKKLLLAIFSLAFFAITASAQETGTCGDNLTYILSADSVLTIKGTGAMKTNAFIDRVDIKSAVIEEGATSIGQNSFRDCSSLTSITIPSSVTIIEYSAFLNCSSLASITIPSSVTSIGDYAFFDCTGIKRIISSATKPAACDSYWTFYGIDSDIPVYVPEASINDYMSAEGWNEFTNYQSIESSVDETAAEALVVTAENGTVSVNAEEFAIMNLAGVDVTAENGSLSGVYLVKAGTEVVKVMVR